MSQQTLKNEIENAEQHNLGRDMTNAAKARAEAAAKKAAADKLGLTAFRKAVADKLGITAFKKAVASGASAVAKAGLTAAKGALSSFLSTPIGWVVLAVGIVILLMLLTKDDGTTEFLKEMTTSTEPVITYERDGVTHEELSEIGVVLLMTDDCPEVKSMDVGTMGADMSMEANARALYSVFKGYGLTDECIAGMLGNYQTECSIDPTSIEGIYNEPHRVGPKKQSAFEDLDHYTQGTVFSLYAASGVSINRNAYKAADGKCYPGIGLAQWTGPAAYTLISTGSATGRAWYSMDYQLAFMVSDTHYRNGFFAGWKEHPSATPEEAAAKFARDYEGNTALGYNERKSNARAWYEKMASWNVDTEYCASIMALSSNMGGNAGDMEIAKRSGRCKTAADVYDNSTMAAAAVSYAYPTKEGGRGNNGTALYQRVHQAIFPGDPYYMSCDRTVACAVRWSGSDDTYPPGSTDVQLSYLENGGNGKWEFVGYANDLTMDDLSPGDVFIVSGHTFMYTGSEVIQSVHGAAADARFDSVSGSFNSRSPGCGADVINCLNHGGKDSSGRGPYKVFRCVNPDLSVRYKDAGGSALLGS